MSAGNKSKEVEALYAFLAAMHDSKLDGGRMREAMLEALGIANQKALHSRIEADEALIRSHLEALNAALEWDFRRNYVMPYKVRDPMTAAITALRKRLESSK